MTPSDCCQKPITLTSIGWICSACKGHPRLAATATQSQVEFKPGDKAINAQGVVGEVGISWHGLTVFFPTSEHPAGADTNLANWELYREPPKPSRARLTEVQEGGKRFYRMVVS